ncbi:MAG: ComF family protein [Treponema sp.]|nr:ComF family protein [Treponema sp.]
MQFKSGNGQTEKCDYCGKPLISEHKRCLPCRNRNELSFDRAMVLFPYTGKYRKLLASYKFEKNIALGNFFAEKICEEITYNAERGDVLMPSLNFLKDTQLVPVPPRPGKIRKNGWDQVEYLTKLLERGKNISVSRCLKRLPSKSQKELDREMRQSNLRGRIITIRQPPKIAVLLDDVITTGSTLDACAAALKENGAEKVYGLCLFYD